MIRDRGHVLVVALCGAGTYPDRVQINRKFHTGILEYVKRLEPPLVCVLPRLTDEEARATIDLVDVRLGELPYQVKNVSSRSLAKSDLPLLQDLVRSAALVYCSPSEPLSVCAMQLCHRHRVPYIAVTEHSLRTKYELMCAVTPGLARRAWRATRIWRRHRVESALLRRACELHANGYPAYEECGRLNPNTVFYLDSRMRAADIIPHELLASRLASLESGQRPARLLYSGRYVAIKGALDVIRVGLELQKRGLDYRLDTYGAGPLEDEMRRMVTAHAADKRIFVHGPIPFSPNLIAETRQADLFLCCHVQGDPSCTYLETCGCGVPIIGYANGMWSGFARDAKAGLVIKKHDHEAMADAASSMLGDPRRLELHSQRARNFAVEHSMERTWDLRSSRIRSVIGSPRAQTHSG